VVGRSGTGKSTVLRIPLPLLPSEVSCDQRNPPSADCASTAPAADCAMCSRTRPARFRSGGQERRLSCSIATSRLPEREIRARVQKALRAPSGHASASKTRLTRKAQAAACETGWLRSGPESDDPASASGQHPPAALRMEPTARLVRGPCTRIEDSDRHHQPAWRGGCSVVVSSRDEHDPALRPAVDMLYDGTCKWWRGH